MLFTFLFCIKNFHPSPVKYNISSSSHILKVWIYFLSHIVTYTKKNMIHYYLHSDKHYLCLSEKNFYFCFTAKFFSQFKEIKQEIFRWDSHLFIFSLIHYGSLATKNVLTSDLKSEIYNLALGILAQTW